MRLKIALSAACMTLAAGLAQAQATQGVSKNEIVVGSIQDRSSNLFSDNDWCLGGLPLCIRHAVFCEKFRHKIQVWQVLGLASLSAGGQRCQARVSTEL